MPPLDNLKVIDLTRVLAGPFCTMMLGDMGAQVIKVEEPERGDEVRGWEPRVDGWSSYFLGVNRNKKSIALDLKDAKDGAVLRALIAQADVFVENFKPGSMARLGFGYDDMAQLNPRLVYCSISGYGQTGPRSDGPPTRVGIAISDYLAGLYAIQGILLAIMDRQRTGLGQRVDVALYDALLSTMTLHAGVVFQTGDCPSRAGNDHPSIAPYETFKGRGGSIIVAAGNPRLWTQLCASLGAEHLATDPRFATNADRLLNRTALKEELESRFQRFELDDLVARLAAHDVPCGRVRTLAEALRDPQVNERQMVLTMPHAALGTVRSLGNPVKLSRTPAVVTLPPPALGEHTDEVVKALWSS
jgi:crotonobetainyl-CoA:carnitine CoA-transferase CaiB-like acyl-CoA transferase